MKDGSILKFDAEYYQISELIKTTKYPSLSVRFAYPHSKCLYEIYVDYFKIGKDVPPMKLEVEQDPNFIWLIPTSGVYYCKEK